VRAAKASGEKAVKHATEQLAAAEQAAGETRRVADATPRAEAKANTTDPESRIMKTQTGWVQGFNAQAAVNANQVVVAAEVTQDHNDANQLIAMMEATVSSAMAAGISEPIEMVLADAGYWSEDNATAPGPDRLIATLKDWKQRKAARELGTTQGDPPPGASVLEAMEHRLRTEEGAALYALRSCTVEPIFGQAKENRGVRRFMRRGLDAAQSEWSLICATSNILKLFTRAEGSTLGQLITPPLA